jgi:hypothetical protein
MAIVRQPSRRLFQAGYSAEVYSISAHVPAHAGKLPVALRLCSDEDILGQFRQSRRHPWYPVIGKRLMTKLHAFVPGLLVLTLTVAMAWGQTSGGSETVSVHSGSATLHAMLWRPQGRGPFPAILRVERDISGGVQTGLSRTGRHPRLCRIWVP